MEVFSAIRQQGVSGSSMPDDLCGRRREQKEPELGGKPAKKRIARI